MNNCDLVFLARVVTCSSHPFWGRSLCPDPESRAIDLVTAYGTDPQLSKDSPTIQSRLYPSVGQDAGPSTKQARHQRTLPPRQMHRLKKLEVSRKRPPTFSGPSSSSTFLAVCSEPSLAGVVDAAVVFFNTERESSALANKAFVTDRSSPAATRTAGAIARAWEYVGPYMALDVFSRRTSKAH